MPSIDVSIPKKISAQPNFLYFALHSRNARQAHSLIAVTLQWRCICPGGDSRLTLFVLCARSESCAVVAGVGLPDQVLEANHRRRSTANIVQGLHDMCKAFTNRGKRDLYAIFMKSRPRSISCIGDGSMQGREQRKFCRTSHRLSNKLSQPMYSQRPLDLTA